MSYSVVGQDQPGVLGAVVASSVQACQGGEVSENFGERGDHCCKVSTWSASTYKDVKGTSSWRRWREKVLRLALERILSPSDVGFPTELHQMAYDAGLNPSAAVPQGLVDSLAVAYRNFVALYPPERWVKQKNCVRGKYKGGVCTLGEKKLSCWISTPPSHLAPKAFLISQLVGVPVTTGHLETVQSWDDVPPPNVRDSATSLFRPSDSTFNPWSDKQTLWSKVPVQFASWALAVRALIDSMPRSKNNMTGGNEYVPPTKDFFVVENGVVKPKAWTSRFIEAFRPKGIGAQVSKAASTRVAASQATGPVSISKSSTLHRVSATSDDGDEGIVGDGDLTTTGRSDGGTDPRILAVGGVAVVALGFGAFVFLRRSDP